MKQFFKFLLATILGVFIAGFIGILVIMGIAGSGDGEVIIKDNAVLKLNLSEITFERSNQDPFADLNPFNSDLQVTPGLYEVLEAIQSAKANKKVKGIYLEMSFFPMGIAAAKEIRDALIDFKSADKFVVSYAEIMDQKSYYIASVSDKICLNPKGNVELLGLSTNITFFTKALENIGVEMQIIRHGQFKSAVEPFLLTEMSEANELQTSAFINSLWATMVEGITSARKVSLESFYETVNSGAALQASGAFDAKLVDELFYKDQAMSLISTKLGISDDSEIDFYSVGELNDASPSGYNKEKIAVIFAHGNVVDGNAGEGSVGSTRISKAIKKAREDKNVKAIVLRINSPGGSALASEVIWREIVLTKNVKPLVASMGDVAASGGYYIACLADTIVAQPNTITGSIGVFGMIPNMNNLLTEKVGLSFDGVKTNTLADFGSLNRALTEGERALLQSFIEDTYETFTSRVAEGRSISQDSVDQVGQGRVWSGVDAKNIGLVDVMGGLQDAIGIAADMANLESYRLLALPKIKDPIQQILDDLSGNVKLQFIESDPVADQYMKAYSDIKEIMSHTGIQCWMPYQFDWQ